MVRAAIHKSKHSLLLSISYCCWIGFITRNGLSSYNFRVANHPTDYNFDSCYFQWNTLFCLFINLLLYEEKKLVAKVNESLN